MIVLYNERVEILREDNAEDAAGYAFWVCRLCKGTSERV